MVQKIYDFIKVIPQTDTALYMNIYITIEWLFVPVVPFN